MCLSVNYFKTVRARKRKGPTTRYKLVDIRVSKTGEIGLYSAVYNHKWKPGWHKSGASVMPLEQLEKRGSINRAIHVYMTARDARSSLTGMRTVIKVHCNPDDLIACGNNDEAYTQVYFSYEEYNRVVREFTSRVMKNIFSGYNYSAQDLAVRRVTTPTVQAAAFGV